jgi:hypothetical protein
MDEQSKRLLDSFATLANKSLLHPRDWRRFFDYVIDAHRRVVSIESADVIGRLRAHQFTEDMARRLATFIEPARELLTHYEKRHLR